MNIIIIIIDNDDNDGCYEENLMIKPVACSFQKNYARLHFDRSNTKSVIHETGYTQKNGEFGAHLISKCRPNSAFL